MPQKHLRRPEVEHVTGLSRTTIYRLMSAGEFPRPVRLTTKAVAWPESEIENWLQSRTKTG